MGVSDNLGQTPLITYHALKFRFAAHAEHLLAERPRSKSARIDTATKLSPGGGFLLAVLLSPGLWVTIWKAVSVDCSLAG